MASIHKRGEKWLLYWRDPTGRQRAKTFERLRDAQEKRWEVEPIERRRLTPAVDPHILVPEYAKRWLKLVESQVQESTLASYASTLRLHVCGMENDPKESPLKATKDGLLARMQVRDLRKGHIKELLSLKLAEKSRRGKPLSVDSVRLIHATVRAMLDWAVDDELILQNPAADLGRKLGLSRSKRQRQEEKSPFTAEQRDLFHAVCFKKDPELYPLFFTLERAGLRIGEGLMLRLNDVNLKAREIRVARSLCRLKRVAKNPKSGHGRTVEMSTDLKNVLQPLVVQRRRDGLAGGDTNPLLFASRAGTPYWHGNVERRFTRVLKAAGLPLHHTPHDLRHTYATLLLEAGVDVQWIQAQMGHASIQTTVDEYGKWMKPRKGLADRLDNPVSTAATPPTETKTAAEQI